MGATHTHGRVPHRVRLHAQAQRTRLRICWRPPRCWWTWCSSVPWCLVPRWWLWCSSGSSSSWSARRIVPVSGPGTGQTRTSVHATHRQHAECHAPTEQRHTRTHTNARRRHKRNRGGDMSVRCYGGQVCSGRHCNYLLAVARHEVKQRRGVGAVAFCDERVAVRFRGLVPASGVCPGRCQQH